MEPGPGSLWFAPSFLAALGEANLWFPSQAGQEGRLWSGQLGREHGPGALHLGPWVPRDGAIGGCSG